jgi:hypothetical protein
MLEHVRKTNGGKALIAVTIFSNYTKSYGTILNSFSWPLEAMGSGLSFCIVDYLL